MTKSASLLVSMTGAALMRVFRVFAMKDFVVKKNTKSMQENRKYPYVINILTKSKNIKVLL